jgi:hypothetical protein
MPGIALTFVFQLMEIKQEVFDETVYHDALDDPLDEEEEEVYDSGSYGDSEMRESEENDVDNDQGSPVSHDSRSGTIKKF